MPPPFLSFPDRLEDAWLYVEQAASLARAENLLLGADWCLTPRMVSSHASLMLSVRSKIILANETHLCDSEEESN